MAKSLSRSTATRESAAAAAEARRQSDLDEKNLLNLYESVAERNWQRDSKAFERESKKDRDLANIQWEAGTDAAFAGASAGSRAENVKGSYELERAKLQRKWDMEDWDKTSAFQRDMADQDARFQRERESAGRQMQRDLAARGTGDISLQDEGQTSRSLASNASAERIAGMGNALAQRKGDQDFEARIRELDLGQYNTFMNNTQANPAAYRYWG